jgi:hypothetical protein
MQITSKVIVSNNGAEWTFTLEHSDNRNNDRLRNRFAYEFMAYYDLLRKVKSKGFKATLPFHFKITKDDKVVLDTQSKVLIEAGVMLKLQNSEIGRVRFMNKLKHISDYAHRPTSERELADKLLGEAKAMLND